MAVAKKLIKEDGVVIGREIKKATEEFVGADGKVVPAREQRFVVHCITSSIVDDHDGMQYISAVDFEVDKETYMKCTYLKKIEGIFEFTATDKGGRNTPVRLIVK